MAGIGIKLAFKNELANDNFKKRTHSNLLHWVACIIFQLAFDKVGPELCEGS